MEYVILIIVGIFAAVSAFMPKWIIKDGHKTAKDNLANENNPQVVTKTLTTEKGEMVNHPKHYTWLKDKCGIEVIDIVRHLDFDSGNAIKYILRAGHKEENGISDRQKAIEDFKKAVWYLNDRIKTMEGGYD